MSRRSAFVVRLSAEERAVLLGRAASRTARHAEVVRARIVLLAAEGEQNVDIARRVGVCVDVASKWRKRFCQEGLAGLVDRPRSGRPRVFGSEVVAGIKALACERPERRGVALARWSSLELAGHAVSEGLVETISSSTVRRWLHGAAIKPWRYRSWIFPRDPDFAAKAARVLDLYARVVDGVPLGPTSTSSRQTRSPSSRRSLAATRSLLGRRGARAGSNSSTPAAARSVTWAPTTSMRLACSAGSPRSPASCRSWSLSTTS